MNEKILAPAVWFKFGESPEFGPTNIDIGFVITGVDQNSILHLYLHLTRKVPNEKLYMPGFLTTKNRFVDRWEAMKIAKQSSQVPNSMSRDELLSTDLCL